jgi:hypothetical protein
VKGSVRDELTWDVTHWYMEAMLGISLYRYPYLTTKNALSLLLLLLFSLQQNSGLGGFFSMAMDSQAFLGELVCFAPY